MATKFSIVAVYKALTNQFTGPVKNMGKINKKIVTSIKTDFAKAQRSVMSFGRTVKQQFGRVLKTAVIGGFLALSAGLALASVEFVKFSQTITEAGARFKDIEIGSEKSIVQIDALKKAARGIGATTQFTAVQGAQALDFYARAGFKSAEAIGVLESSIDLATVTGMEFARAADISSDLLGSFGKNSQDAATKIKNLKELNNSLGLAVNMANVTLEDLFETLKVGAPIGVEAGATMNELVAITAALGSAGIKGGLAATALKNAWIRLASPTKAVVEALDSINLEADDFILKGGKMMKMTDIMELLGKKAKGLGDVKRLALFSEIFGKRAVAGALNISKSLEDIGLIMQKLEGDAKIKDIADEIRKGLGLRLEILKSSLIELGFKFIEAFEKHGTGALLKLTELVQKFDPAPIIKGIKTTVKWFIKFFKVLKPFMPLIITMIALWKLYFAGMIIAAIIAPFIKFIKAVSLLMKAQKSLNIVQAIWNVLMTSNPIGVIIIAIGILIGLIILIVKNWDTIGPAITKAVKVSLKWLDKMWTIILNLWDKFKGLGLIFAAPFTMLIEVIRSVIDHWGDIKKAFTEGGILSGIFAIGKAIVSGLLAPIQSLLELLSNIPFLKDIATGGAAKIAELRQSLFAGSSETQTAQAPISPAERSSLIRQETTERSELTIKDETGRAKVSKAPTGKYFNLNLQTSGGI